MLCLAAFITFSLSQLGAVGVVHGLGRVARDPAGGGGVGGGAGLQSSAEDRPEGTWGRVAPSRSGVSERVGAPASLQG